jgi:hypothetical protein
MKIIFYKDRWEMSVLGAVFSNLVLLRLTLSGSVSGKNIIFIADIKR